MDSSLLSLIYSMVKGIKKQLFCNFDLYSFVSASAYDTAWLAMIPDPEHTDRPLYENCLNWVLENQKEEGFWGEIDENGLPSIDTLPATLACLLALKTWTVGSENINKGLAFINVNVWKLVKGNGHRLPRWFVIVFPAMVDLAQAAGFEPLLPDGLQKAVTDISFQRDVIFKMEKLVDEEKLYPPILSYLEAFPETYNIDEEFITSNLSEDGSLFQSPSATARAFMTTGNKKCKDFLASVVQQCVRGGVPSRYPMDEELVKLSMIDQIQRLGLAEYFDSEIEQTLANLYRAHKKKLSALMPTHEDLTTKLYKDALAFRLLRMHGYDVNPERLCWFLHDENIMATMEKNYEHIRNAMYSVYRATELTFPGEHEMVEAKRFSKKLLQKSLKLSHYHGDFHTFPILHQLIEHELSLPWMARLEHLDHQLWIQHNKVSPKWTGKASFYRLSCIHNAKLMKLASKNYLFRQLVYKNELEELKRWSKEWGLNDMGFGREKTTYSYFAVSASISLPHDSPVRLIVAKSAILITVADDFFDMEGSLTELKALNKAIQRWDGRGLNGHSKFIYDALENFLKDTAVKHLSQQGFDIHRKLQDIWSETFRSWMTESRWAKTGYMPSMDEYLTVGMTSIATHTLVLPAACFMNPSIPKHKFEIGNYDFLTKLLMVSARMLNDVQSYNKERDDGKMNSVTIHYSENPHGDIEDSVAHVNTMLDEKKKEFLQHALMNDFSCDFPKSCKRLHLSCLKVFQMFFNSKNLFDTKTELANDIKKAIYSTPTEYQTPKIVMIKTPPPFFQPTIPKENAPYSTYNIKKSFKTQQVLKITSKTSSLRSLCIPHKVSIRMI